MVKKKEVNKIKEVVILIEYRVWSEDLGYLGEALENLRQVGAAEILDVRLEEKAEKI